jgi:hypothetical protein
MAESTYMVIRIPTDGGDPVVRAEGGKLEECSEGEPPQWAMTRVHPMTVWVAESSPK